MPPRKSKTPIKRRKVKTSCLYCKEKKSPDYKEYKLLSKSLSERAKIIGSDYTGICSKHQRRLTKAVKRARHLGLLPFTASL